ncbi:MAG: ORF6N domain-containing protein [Bacteroidetes bacterium]|nr:ORF6N domain-containing protein [Bacteroidota bacterium]
MENKEEPVMISDSSIINQIYFIRRQKVMIDRDLAILYGVETRTLKQAVNRNMQRFPADFMFEMSITEFENWRSQFVTSNSDKMGLRHKPYCFTEQGVAMLSSILKSEKAILVNIQIIRIFTRLKQMLIDSTEIRLEIEQIKQKLGNQSKNIELVFQYLDKLLEKKENKQERPKIGYKLT